MNHQTVTQTEFNFTARQGGKKEARPLKKKVVFFQRQTVFAWRTS